MTSIDRFQHRLQTWADSFTACWQLFIEVNAQPDVLPPWPRTAVGRLVWTPFRWLGGGLALVASAALGALLGVEAERDVDAVFDQLPELFGLVAVAVAVGSVVHLVGWICRFLVYAGGRGAHSLAPSTVVAWVVGCAYALLTVLCLALTSPL
jgi:hypothetical protein